MEKEMGSVYVGLAGVVTSVTVLKSYMLMV